MIFLKALKKRKGKNNLGQLTHKCGGKATHKKKYRFIDFKKEVKNVIGIIKRIEKDPYRSAFIALVYYINGLFSYIIATHNLTINSLIYNFTQNEIPEYNQLILGNSFCIKNLPTGILINNIELIPTLGSCLVRAAGTSAKLIKIYNNNYIQIKLRSGEQRLINKFCFVTLGMISNINNHLKKLKKAGQSRWLGIAPHVRGRAKNPVDHPHGGRTNGGIIPRTPKGVLTKGIVTRKKNNLN